MAVGISDKYGRLLQSGTGSKTVVWEKGWWVVREPKRQLSRVLEAVLYDWPGEDRRCSIAGWGRVWVVGDQVSVVDRL